MKYSFILPAYKAAFLKQSIDSILSQTFSEFELVIINDASPEGLDSIVNSYKDPRIKYYKNQDNIGGKDLVAQWNHCLGYANSEYIILASDDDVYMPTYLEEMDALVDKYPAVNIFRPRVQHIDAEGNIIGVEAVLMEYVEPIEYHYYWLKEWIFRGIPFYVFRLSALKDVGGFRSYPLAWCSDDDIVMRLLSGGLVASRKILFSFRLSGESITSRKSSMNDVRLKSKAIYNYYLELNKNLKKITRNEMSKYHGYMMSYLNIFLDEKWINNEISRLCFKISYNELLQLTNYLLNFDTINMKELIKIHIRYIKRYLFH